MVGLGVIGGLGNFRNGFRKKNGFLTEVSTTIFKNFMHFRQFTSMHVEAASLRSKILLRHELRLFLSLVFSNLECERGTIHHSIKRMGYLVYQNIFSYFY